MIFKRFSLLNSIIFVGAASFISSGTKFILTLILVRFLTPQEFGLWAALTSIAAILMFGDLGIGNALRNKLSNLKESHSKDENLQREYFYTTLYIFIIIGFLGSASVFLFGEMLPINKLFKTEDIAIIGMGDEILTFLLLYFFISLPIGISNGLFYSYNESNILAIITVISSCSVLLLISFLIIFTNSNVVLLFKTQYFLIFSLGLFSTIYFIYRRNWLNSFLIDIRNAYSRFIEILKGGILFMGNDITSSFLINSPTIFIAAIIDLQTAAFFNIIQKIFTFFGGIIQAMLNPVWAELATLKARGEIGQAMFIANITSLINGVFLIFITIILYFNIDLILTWIAGSDNDYEINKNLVIFIGLTFTGYAIYDSVSLIQKSFGSLKLRFIIQLISVLILIPLINFAYNLFGVLGIPSTMTVVWIVLSFILIIQRKFIQKNLK